MQARTLMVQGTTSDAGKSALVTGLCRYFKRQGELVVPFKPQNMALNSAVTSDGGEIGRAQAVQAKACGLDAHTDMNPVLLKPNSDKTAQVILQGKVLNNLDAKAYHAYKKQAMPVVLGSFRRLQRQYQRVIVEGAGSPAEINLRQGDVANMGFAEAVDCPVILVADIDKGGVFAHLYGTLKLLSNSEQQRIKGFIINKFRGDQSLLEPGNDWLEDNTQVPVLGVLPYLHNLHIEAEDAIAAAADNKSDNSSEKLQIIVPVLPRIANHTDFDALRLHPQVELHFIRQGQPIPPADVIIIPGTKNVRADLNWLTDNHWDSAIAKHLRYGGKLLGICGGLQMLGSQIHDPQGVEGASGSSCGLGYFSYQTVLQENKQLKQIQGTFQAEQDINVSGYEIHAGCTIGLDNYTALLQIEDKAEGAVSDDNQIIVTYVHGLFDHTEACQYLLNWAGLNNVQDYDYRQLQEESIDLLADTLEQYLDINAIKQLFNKS